MTAVPPWSHDATTTTGARAEPEDLAAITTAGLTRYARGAGWAWRAAASGPGWAGRWRRRDPGLLWQSFETDGGAGLAAADPLAVARAVHAVARVEGRSERDAAWMLARVSRATGS